MNGYDKLKERVRGNTPPPCISLIIPIIHTIPERSQNIVIFNKLVDSVLKEVAHIDTPEARKSETYLKKISTEVNIDRISSHGIAILVDAQGYEIIELTTPCNAYTSVGTIFALSEIVQSMQNKEQYWILLIGKKYARLFQYTPHHITEIVTPTHDDAGQPLQGFPLDYIPPADQVKTSVTLGDRGGDDSDSDAEIRHFFQLINTELHKIITSHRKFPVILCGTPEYTQLFKRVAQHKDIFMLDIPRDYSAHQNINNHLATDVEQALKAYHDEQEKQLLGLFEDALNSSKQACGMAHVWETVSTGRIQTLLLEPQLSEVGRVNPDNPLNLQIFPRKSDISINRVADLLIYEALRHDGTIRIVKPTSLKSCKGIGGILRY